MGLFDVFKVDVRVRLDRHVYYPGNAITGVVEANVTSPISFVAIRVKVTAKERVVITKQEITYYQDQNGMQQQRSTPRTYCASTAVWKQLLTLCGQMKNGGSRMSQTLPPGRYVFPFQFVLPLGVPPSFIRNSGDDRAALTYCVKAYVDIPNGKDAKVREYLTVLSALPISQWAHKAPLSVDRQWNVTCCCCISKGVVSARIYMDRSLFAIDRDSVMIYADVDNTRGEEPVQSLEVSLRNCIQYRAQGQAETNYVTVGHNLIQQVVPPGQRGIIQGIVPVPRNAVPTVSTMNCTSTYTMDIELNIPMASDPKHSFPVVLCQSVDETNAQMPVGQQQQMMCIPPGVVTPEYYYAPPPHPAMQPILPPLPPPPMVQMVVYGAPMYAVAPQAGYWDSCVGNPNAPPAPLGGAPTGPYQSPPPPGGPQSYSTPPSGMAAPLL